MLAMLPFSVALQARLFVFASVTHDVALGARQPSLADALPGPLTIPWWLNHICFAHVPASHSISRALPAAVQQTKGKGLLLACINPYPTGCGLHVYACMR